jgi:hypothetical protein
VRQSAVGGLEPLREKLTDDVEVENVFDGELELLRLRLVDRR